VTLPQPDPAVAQPPAAVKQPDPPVKWWMKLIRRGSRATSSGAAGGTSAHSTSTSSRSDTSSLGATATNFARQIGTATVCLVCFYAVACVVLGFSLSPTWGREAFTIMFGWTLTESQLDTR
jgi:hypothetical protein